MSGSHYAHVHIARQPPSKVRKVSVQAPPSALSSKAPVAPKITIKAAKGTKVSKEDDGDAFQHDEDDDMASSFLQFWSVTKINILWLCSIAAD